MNYIFYFILCSNLLIADIPGIWNVEYKEIGVNQKEEPIQRLGFKFVNKIRIKAVPKNNKLFVGEFLVDEKNIGKRDRKHADAISLVHILLDIETNEVKIGNPGWSVKFKFVKENPNFIILIADSFKLILKRAQDDGDQ